MHTVRSVDRYGEYVNISSNATSIPFRAAASAGAGAAASAGAGAAGVATAGAGDGAAVVTACA